MQNDVVSGNPTVFDQTALDFAAKVDRLISSGRYRRGNLFVDAATSAAPAKGEILDYGCGPGRISALLARQGFRLLGLDPSPDMIASAKKQKLGGLEVEFQHIGSHPVGAQAAEFDSIVCSSVIEYETEPLELLKKFHEALRPAGSLIISFANSRSLSRALFQRRNLHLGAQVHTWTEDQFKDLLASGGFRAIRPTVFFESFFDRVPPLGALSSSQWAGALGLIVATRQ